MTTSRISAEDQECQNSSIVCPSSFFVVFFFCTRGVPARRIIMTNFRVSSGGTKFEHASKNCSDIYSQCRSAAYQSPRCRRRGLPAAARLLLQRPRHRLLLRLRPDCTFFSAIFSARRISSAHEMDLSGPRAAKTLWFGAEGVWKMARNSRQMALKAHFLI